MYRWPRRTANDPPANIHPGDVHVDRNADVPSPTPTLVPTALPDIQVTLGDDSVARFLVREQLVALEFPNDAIGETPGVTGSLTFNPSGAVIPDQSVITIDLSALKSDSERRDRFLRERSLQTNRFPETRLVVQEIQGLPWPLPQSGEVTFRMVGDMTVRDVTTSVTWDVTASFDGDSVIGRASTAFTFDTFEMEKPRVFLLISVEDDIRLELDFVASVN